MKKQNKSVSSNSIKSIIIVFVLSVMLSSVDAIAINKPAVASNTFTEEVDSDNRIESWMISNNYWGASTAMDEYGEVESNNSIEQWMVFNSFWEKSIQLSEESEGLNQIEAWMNSKFFWGDSETLVNVEEKLPIEAWMSSTSYWVNGQSNDRKITDQSEKTAYKCLPDRKCNL